MDELLVDQAPGPVDFTVMDAYSWYSDLPLTFKERTEAVPAVEPRTVYLLFNQIPERISEVRARGWCLYEVYPNRSLWVVCPARPF